MLKSIPGNNRYLLKETMVALIGFDLTTDYKSGALFTAPGSHGR